MPSLTNQLPEPAELLALYEAVGWTAYTREPDRLVAAVAGSDLVKTARSDAGELVGLARTISDRSSICYLQDVLVHPRAQRSGVGLALMQAVLAHYADVRQFVLLTDDDPTQRAFYAALGLVRSDHQGLHAYLRP